MSRLGRVVVGVDIGTTATKVAGFDEDGGVHAFARAPNRLLSRPGGRAEQDPDEILASTLGALAQTCRGCRDEGLDVASVALGCAMQGLVGVDRVGAPLTPLLTWADRRAERQARRLRDGPLAEGIYRRTGTPLHPSSPLAKVMWFREQEPAIFARAAAWLSLKELLLLRLFDRRLVDVSLASATGFFDIASLRWDPETMDLAGLAPEQLSQPVPMTHCVEGLSAEDARRLALARATPFVVGGSDGALSTIGLGATSPGIVAASVGTSAAVRACARSPGGDENGVTFCYALGPGLWLRGAASSSGGGTLAWLQGVLGGPRPATLDELLEGAAEVPAGAEGLLFLPHLHGERAPRRDPDARGVLFGLQAHDGVPQLARAVLEGIALHLTTVVALVEASAGPVTELRVGGGMTRSVLWRQILTDCLGRAVLFSDDPESSLRGAALVALEAIGEARDGARPALIRLEPTGEAAVYRRLLPLFEDLYRRVEPLFSEVGGPEGTDPVGGLG
jgi:gluconokinase